jgi:hypothetical protein
MVDFAIALTRSYVEGVLAAAGPYLSELPLREALATAIDIIAGGLASAPAETEGATP